MEHEKDWTTRRQNKNSGLYRPEASFTNAKNDYEKRAGYCMAALHSVDLVGSDLDGHEFDFLVPSGLSRPRRNFGRSKYGRVIDWIKRMFR